MHRIDTDGNIAGAFDDGDETVPRQATVVDDDWLNAIQEEVCNFIEDAPASIPLVKGTYTQLIAAFAVRLASGLTTFLGAVHSWTAAQTFSAITTMTASLSVSATANNNGTQSSGSGSGYGMVAIGGSTGGGIEGRSGASGGYGVEARSLNSVNSALRVTPQSAEPSTGAVGDVYYHSGAGKLRVCYTGGTPGLWADLN